MGLVKTIWSESYTFKAISFLGLFTKISLRESIILERFLEVREREGFLGNALGRITGIFTKAIQFSSRKLTYVVDRSVAVKAILSALKVGDFSVRLLLIYVGSFVIGLTLVLLIHSKVSVLMGAIIALFGILLFLVGTCCISLVDNIGKSKIIGFIGSLIDPDR